MKEKRRKKYTVNNLTPTIKVFLLNNKRAFFSIFFLFILILSLALRIYHLDKAPTGVSEKEADFGLLALNLENAGIINSLVEKDSGVFTLLLFLGFKVFGINFFGLRIVSALIGILTILGFFLLLGKLKFPRSLSLLGTFLISCSFWHINLSRLALPEILIPFSTIWFSFFLFCGFFSKKYKYFILSGAFFTLGVLVYPLMLFLIFIPIFFFSFFIFLDKKLLLSLRPQLFLFIFSILFFSIPLFFQIQNNPGFFRNNFIQFADPYESSTSIIKSTLAYLGSFFYINNTLQLQNKDFLPAFPLAWLILFIFGFFLSAKNITLTILGSLKNKSIPKNIHASILAQSIFFVAILTGLLNSKQSLSSEHFSLIMPAIFIFCIIPLEYLLEVYQKLRLSIRISLKKWRWNVMQISMLILLLAIILTGFSQTYLYFGIFQKELNARHLLQKKDTDFGKIIKSINREKNNFIIFSGDIASTENLKTIEFSGFPEIENYTFVHSQEDFPQINCEDSLVVFYDSNELLRKQFQKQCPLNNSQKQFYSNGKQTFWTMKE